MTRSSSTIRLRLARAGLVLSAALAALLCVPAASPAQSPCATPVINQVACENTKAGADPSTWQIDGDGDPALQGFATKMSVAPGEAQGFKIKAASTNYRVSILRLGYYGGDGARVIASNLAPTGSSTQPNCFNDANSGLVDCGNWATSLSWTVPSDAVSGVYIAHLRNQSDPDIESHIMFVVRDPAGNADVVVQTSDQTWQSYNSYGGNSLYICTVDCPTGDPAAYKAAYKVSYNRPLDTERKNPRSAFFAGGEYPMVRFLERNGYDVEYVSSLEVETQPSLLLNNKIFISSGHDEYWSKNQRSNVEAARDAGVNLAFFSGNEVFWKTRWEPSIAGPATANRTLVSYKDTHFPAQEDPVEWTGTWADSRFTSASEATAQNALTGQLFLVNSGTSDIKVPFAFSKLRFWRGTSVANLTAGQTATLAEDTLGYEWDVDVDNGYRPEGIFRLSSTTAGDLEVFTDYGSTTLQGQTATHNMTIYRAASGALVFGSGTVQWSWGLDDMNGGFTTPHPAMQQATVNLFADMHAQPATRQSGLSAASASTDSAAPTTTISSPPSAVNDGQHVTLSGTASDTGGGVVAGVEISTDGGESWHPTQGTGTWTYDWVAHGNPTAAVKVRAIDDSGNIGNPGSGTPVTVNCPCSIWGTGFTPTGVVANDPTSIEVGVKFQSEKYGLITGVRFWKTAGNTGTHTGSLWTASGQRLAQATFQSETATGWQTVTFSQPVTVLPDTTYVASYYAPNGNYAATSDYFYRQPAPGPLGGAVIDGAPLHALNESGGQTNGVFVYAGTSTFPTGSFRAANYWVDVTYAPIPAAGAASNVTATAGRGAANVSWSAPSSGGAPTAYEITPYIGSTPQTSTTITGTPPATSATVKNLTPGTSYTFRVRASNPNGAGALSAASNAVTVLAPIAPSAPTAVSAAPASSKARITWTAPDSDGGSDITGYRITPYIGSQAQAPITLPPGTTNHTVTGLTNGTTYRFTVTAVNAIGSTESAQSPAVTPQFMLFDLTSPTIVDGGDGSPVELGMKFKADAYGVVNGVRFFKAAANTGTHVGSLWSASGQLLARVTFASESASGWQSATFDAPVEIEAGATYIVSYHAPNGHYSITAQEFDAAVDNPPLHAIANGTSQNGLYAYTGSPTLPVNSYRSANYWVDVMFMPTPPPGQVSSVTATADRAAANVSWSAPATGGAPTSYVVTPYIGSTALTPKTVTGSPLPTSTTVKGLTPGASYTFRVRAVNPNGSGPLSAASNAVTPLSPIAPSAPTGVSAEAASQMARVRWTEPASDGGSPITGYTVTPIVNGEAQPATEVGPAATSATIEGLSNGLVYRFRVTATNAVGSTQSIASPDVIPAETIFDLATPDRIDGGDGDSVELGVKFRSDVGGWVTGVRFYKAAANTGTHVGNLWSANGQLLARATFSGESASGWQTVTFAERVHIEAGTTYVASYHAPAGHYSIAADAFVSAVVNPPLRAVANSTSENGVYAYAGSTTFPNNSYRAANYWVDVAFVPEAPPGQVTGVSATPNQGGATVSWTAPVAGGTPTSYVVTPYVGSTAQTPKTVSGTPLDTTTTIGGLTTGTQYTFRVRAANANGSGPESAPSSAITPLSADAPAAPTNVSAAAANTSAHVTWTAPASDGGSAITGYTVTPYVGTVAQTPAQVGAGATSTTVNGLTVDTPYRFRVTATNAVGSTQSDPSASVTPYHTLFGLATPSTVDAGDGGAVEIGVKFTASQNGRVTGVRFYKAAANTGTHVGSLWTGTTLLGRATFTGESASGWQTATFETPVDIVAGTTYLASYHAPNGHYSVTGGAFGSPISSPPLQALSNATSPNGVYAYSATPTRPNNDFNATNYWVDVNFTPITGG